MFTRNSLCFHSIVCHMISLIIIPCRFLTLKCGCIGKVQMTNKVYTAC
jgi:hypothetical protein